MFRFFDKSPKNDAGITYFCAANYNGYMTKPQLLITGANGQLGRELQTLTKRYPNIDFYFTGRQTLDITDKNAIDTIFARHSFQYCINCAAYTAVDKAETEKETATAINVTGTQNLANACQQYGVQLIHISSDYVYHNGIDRPLKENDTTQPQGVYAATKLDGENVALASITQCHGYPHFLGVLLFWAQFCKNDAASRPRTREVNYCV